MITPEVRKVVLSHLDAGHSVPEIYPIFKGIMSKRTLYSIASDYQKGIMKTSKAPQKNRSKKVTPNIVKRMTRCLTTGRAHYSYRSVAKLLNVSEGTVRYHAKLRGINCYKKQRQNLIPKLQREKRRLCCMRIRKKYRTSDLPKLLFADECYVVVGKNFNHQNERCYGKELDLIPDHKKFREFPKTSLCAMIFGTVSSGGRSKLIVLKSGFRLNQHTYKEECLKPLLRSLPSNLDPATTIFWQDKAPCHIAAPVQAFLGKKLPCFVRKDDVPPGSPDLNPLDFCIWSLLKERLNKYGLITNFEKLAKILKKEWRAIPQKVIRDSCDSWLRRVRKVENAGGGHIE